MADKDDLYGAAGVPADYEATEDDEQEWTPDTARGGVEDDEGGWHFDIPAGVGRYLKPDEEKVIPLRRHVGLLALPALATAGGLAAAITINAWLYYHGGEPGWALHLLWLSWIAVLGWSAYKWLSWRQTWFVVTGHRIMLIQSVRVLGRHVTMLPISKLRDVKLEQTVSGRMAGYGTLDFASIGTENALDRVDFLPYPEWLYQQISELSMPEDTRKVVKQRRGSRS